MITWHGTYRPRVEVQDPPWGLRGAGPGSPPVPLHHETSAGAAPVGAGIPVCSWCGRVRRRWAVLLGRTGVLASRRRNRDFPC